MLEFILRYLSRNQVIAGIIIVVIGWLLFEVREILVGLFISYVIMAGLAPLVSILQNYKIPKGPAVFISYFSVFVVLIGLIIPTLSFLITQLESFLLGFPFYFDQAARALRLNVDSSNVSRFISSEFDTIGQNAVALTGQVFGGLFSLLTIFVVSFYLLMERERIRNGLASLFPTYEKDIRSTLEQIDEKLGAWVRGQIALSVTIGLLSWIALTALGINYALPLAILAGILEIVPTIGPIIAAIPAIIVALSISPTTAIFVTLAYVIIQTLENNFIVPKIMQKAVGLNPVIVIVAVTIGAKLMGVVGALLAVPFISFLVIMIRSSMNILSNRRR